MSILDKAQIIMTDAAPPQIISRDFCLVHSRFESVVLWDNSCNKNARVIRIAPTVKSLREAIIDSLNAGLVPMTGVICFSMSDIEVHNVPRQKNNEPMKPKIDDKIERIFDFVTLKKPYKKLLNW